MRQKHLPILIWLGNPADDKSKSQSRSRPTRCAIFFDFSVLNSWKGSVSAESYVLDGSRTRWKSSGKMIAAHSAPIRFTEVQPSCRTTRRGRERRERGWAREGGGGGGGGRRSSSELGLEPSRRVSVGQTWSDVKLNARSVTATWKLQPHSSMFGSLRPSQKTLQSQMDGEPGRLLHLPRRRRRRRCATRRQPEPSAAVSPPSSPRRTVFNLSGKSPVFSALSSSAQRKYILRAHGWVAVWKEVKSIIKQ